MTKRIEVAAAIGILLLAASVASGANIKDTRKPLSLTYLANSGVMLASGETKVLIDALYDAPNPDYRAPAPEVREAILQGRPPFDGIDLVLVTHNHPDHFAAPFAARFLESSRTASLVAPADAVQELQRAATKWQQLAPRVVSLDLKVNETAKRDLVAVSLSAFRTLHSGKREAPMNLMYLVELNGWRIFHEGDADATNDEYRGFGLASAPLDLALVHFWFPLDPDAAKLLQEILKPKHIGLTHLPIRLESDAPSKIEMVRQHYQDIFLLLPGMPTKTF